jgi:hypothetical protein
MTLRIRKLLAAVILTVAQAGTCHGAETARVAVQKTGTFAWELVLIRAHGLEKQANLSVQAVELASPEAGKIARRAGNADLIVRFVSVTAYSCCRHDQRGFSPSIPAPRRARGEAEIAAIKADIARRINADRTERDAS